MGHIPQLWDDVAESNQMSTHSIHQFAEKVSLITDVTNPVGWASALQLALNGSFVIAGIPDNADLVQVRGQVEELRSLGTLASSVEWSRTGGGAEKLVADAWGKFGRLDILVNSLKTKPQSSFLSQQPKMFASTIEVNLTILCELTRHAVDLMAARPKPRIVNIAYEYSETDPIYAATQHAAADLTRALANDLPPHFRVNGVTIAEGTAAPNGFDPELVRPSAGVSPDDAARTVLFLLSSEAQSVNGEMISLR